MIEHLNKLVFRDCSTTEKAIDIRDCLNRRLIYPELIEEFNNQYEQYYKCIICNDMFFDPIYCSKCQNNYCKSCISSNKSESNFYKCDHTNESNELPILQKTLFEKIKVNCFFNCSNKTLNLINYPAHLITCKEKYENNNTVSKTSIFRNNITSNCHNPIPIDVKMNNVLNELQEINNNLSSNY